MEVKAGLGNKYVLYFIGRLPGSPFVVSLSNYDRATLRQDQDERGNQW